MRIRFLVNKEYQSARLRGNEIVEGKVVAEAGKQYEVFTYENSSPDKAYIVFSDGFTIEALQTDFELSGPAVQQPSPTCCKGR